LGVGAIVIGVLAFFYFQGSFSNVLAFTQKQPAEVPFSKMLEGTNSPVDTRVNYLIKSADELTQLWGMLGATGTPPTIDFGSSAVAAVFAGAQPTHGYQIVVSKVEEDSASRKVVVTIAKPPANCVMGSTTTPYEVISFPKTSLPLAHEDVWTTAPCAK
jgi:hypothetical protein